MLPKMAHLLDFGGVFGIVCQPLLGVCAYEECID